MRLLTLPRSTLFVEGIFRSEKKGFARLQHGTGSHSGSLGFGSSDSPNVNYHL